MKGMRARTSAAPSGCCRSSPVKSAPASESVRKQRSTGRGRSGCDRRAGQRDDTRESQWGWNNEPQTAMFQSQKGDLIVVDAQNLGQLQAYPPRTRRILKHPFEVADAGGLFYSGFHASVGMGAVGHSSAWGPHFILTDSG